MSKTYQAIVVGAGLDRLFGEPAIEAGTEDRVAVVRWTVEVPGLDCGAEA